MRLLTLRSILVATDLGDGSQSAIRTAASLARLTEAAIHLVQVTDTSGPDGTTRLREHFESGLADAPEPETVAVIPGDPAEVIVEHAAGSEADAIILGPHRTAGGGGVLGSTAARVVRTARCPCLVAATELHLPLERVLAPIDLSATDVGALSVALSWASALRPPQGQSQLTALHVARHPTHQDERVVHDQVQRARELAGGIARVEIRETIASGDPGDVILRAANADGSHLLVIGTRRTVGSSELGSVSSAVARSTPCPLLLVPPTTLAAHAT